MFAFPVRKLCIDTTLSREDAVQLFLLFFRWGDHYYNDLRGLPDAEIEPALKAQNYNLAKVLADLQNNPHCVIPQFENLFEGGSWTIETDQGVHLTHSVMIDGVQFAETKVQGHAVVGHDSYESYFLAACQARDKAIAESSFDHFYTALAKGFASVEACFNLRVAVHNAKCQPQDRLEEKRPKGGFVSVDEKILEWLPKLTGVNLDPNTSPGWDDFKYLKKLRNDIVIHPKPNAGLSTLEELADGINRFRTGIGSLMFLLHQAFGKPMQRSIIRAMRYPTVHVAVMENQI